MATWHQNQNKSAIAMAWAPEPGKYKCVSDKPGRMASVMVFDNLADAEKYCANTGDVLIMPPEISGVIQ